jgi:RimJ/RimL family protein N-acetyltransferase
MIRTARLSMREMGHGDLDFVASMLADPEVMRYYPRCYSRDEARDWIDRQLGRYARGRHGFWLALDRSSGEPVGQAGLLVQELDGLEELGLGYLIHRPFWRRGLATEAARAWIDHARDGLGCGRVIALIRPENLPSRGVADKLGVRPEGTTLFHGFEHIVYATKPRCAAHPRPGPRTG